MDVQRRLDDIVATLRGARSMPMSASCVVNRAELLAMLEEVRQALPGSLEEARELLGGREQMVADAQQEAQRIIEGARSERAALVDGTEIARAAQAEADRLLAAARTEAAAIREEADDYVDSKLANFEVVLSKTIGSVDRGREKLLGAGPGADAHGADFAEDAPERTADPAELRQRADAYVDARLGSVSAVLGKTLEAVGRGRQKLLGHRPSDELGALAEAAQEYAAHATDAEYLAGLAADVPEQAPPPQQTAYEPPAAPAAAPHDGYGHPAQQPYAEPYPYQQAPYQGQDGTGQAGQDWGVTPDTYYAPQPYYGEAEQPPQQPRTLEETSLFDTGMIDMETVRRYEQGR